MQAIDKVTAYLDEHGTTYSISQHPPFSNTEEAAQEAHVAMEQGAKSMLFKSIGEYVLAVLPATERVSYKKLRGALHTKSLRLATPEEVLATMECEVGTCHPFGNLLGIQTICDPSMADNETIVFNAGLRTQSISITYTDYEAAVQPLIADIKA